MSAETPTPEESSGGGFGGWIGDSIENIGEAIGGTVGFWSDPFGSMYNAARDAVSGLANDLLPALTGATLPDLNIDAFLDTYQVSFALALLIAVVLLLVQLVRTAKGTQSGRDTIHAIGIYFPGFILGVMFGPAMGIIIVNFVHALSSSLVAWAYQGTAEELALSLAGVLIEDPAGFAGGVYIAWMVAWAMAMGLLFVVLLFVVQLVTLYFSGVLIPLAAVWVIDPSRRSTGIRAVSLWVGILLTHPLMFLLLGFAFRLIGGTINSWGSDGWKNLISLLIAVMAMFMAAFSPFFILKFVKSISAGGTPTGGGASVPRIGQMSPARVTSTAAPTGGMSAPGAAGVKSAQVVRGATAPAGPTLGQAAAARTAGSAAGGQVVTAGAGGAARAGMARGAAGGVGGLAATVAVSVARKGYEGARDGAETSVTPPPRESYGKDRL